MNGADGATLATLTYGGTATVRVTNLGRRRKQPEDVGFWLDTVDGRWLSARESPDSTPGDQGLGELADDVRKQKVIPYVQDTRNILITRLAAPVAGSVAVSLQYALERGIEATFQLEDAELTSERLPEKENRARTLFTKSAEGGAGVLRARRAGRPGRPGGAGDRALRPGLGADRDRAEGARERCERACYDCLLSYGNQLDHGLVDRHAVRDLLLALAGSSTRAGAAGRTAVERLADLERRCDSELERNFLRWLADREHRLPSAAQELVDNATARPDFVYRLADGHTAVFVDGPAHDAGRTAQRDDVAEDRLMDAGWNVVRVRYDADWRLVVEKYPSVFGTGRDVPTGDSPAEHIPAEDVAMDGAR